MNSKALTALLIDDEALARQRLKRLLTKHGDGIEIIGEAENGLQAVEMIERKQPDVIFLDIQMPGWDGFEVINQLKKVPQIIFCTAYEEYALKAFDVNGIDYLVKPVRAERLEQAIGKLEVKKSEEVSPDEVMEVVRQMMQQRTEPELTSLPVRVGDRVVFVALSEVLAFEAEDKYVTVISRKGKKYITDLSLKRLMERLPECFVQVHRSIIVNRPNIREIRKYLNNRFILIMNDENQTRFTTGRAYANVVKGLMVV